MRGLSLLRQILNRQSQRIRIRAQWSIVTATQRQSRRPTDWPRIFLLAVVVGGVIGGATSSCVVPDPEYCATREQCPSVETDLGMMQLLCHPTRHVCVNAGPNTCFSDMDCTADVHFPRCDTNTNTCTSCRVGDPSDTSCAHFTDRKICVNAADGSGSLCVGCQSNRDCSMTAPICDNQQCRKCSAHSDCEGTVWCDNNVECTDSLVCIQEGDLTTDLVGRCAQNGSLASGKVLYVNNTDPSQCGAMIAATGTSFTSPLCDLDTAIDLAAVQNRHFIRAVGTGLKPFNKIIAQGSYTFIGAPTRTKPQYKTLAQVDVRGAFATINGTATVTFDQFDIREGNPGDIVMIRCAQTALTPPGLTLKRSILTGGASPTMYSFNGAIVLSSCNAIIDGNIIGVKSMAELSDPGVTVHGTAINVVDSNGGNEPSSYLIQNNIIVGNAGPGINLVGAQGSTPKITLRFNTITRNGRGIGMLAGGVVCPPGGNMREFSHSIVFENSKDAGGTQFTNPTSCKFKDLVVGTAEGGNDPAFAKMDPMLDAMFRLTAKSENSSCCIDKVTPVGSETLPSTDVDGIPRPQNGKWDIGASELKQ